MLFLSRAGCNRARTKAGKSRASSRSWRTRASSSRNAPGADVAYSSISPRGWFVRYPCPLADVVPPAKPFGSSPTSRYKTFLYHSSAGCASTTNGRSAHSYHRWCKPPPGECADTKPARSTACSRALGRTTKARPTPEPLHLLGWRQRGFAPGAASSLTFFEPTSHGVARDAKDAREPAQGSAFVVGSEDLLLTSRIVSRALGILDEAASAGSAAVTLLAFGGVPMPDGTAAVTMSATESIGYYVFHDAS